MLVQEAAHGPSLGPQVWEAELILRAEADQSNSFQARKSLVLYILPLASGLAANATQFD